ncbi:IS3 family transposase [Acinetobacter corruptisaponis]|uniref:IS3 family transposase n=1 Tax=Acinetobacter corruptisaponis TaxID=3045147 RepID=UPI003D7C2D0E
MAKYNKALKLKVVQHYLSGYGYPTTSKFFNIDQSLVRQSVAQYNKNGEAAFSEKQRHRVLSLEIKLAVIESVQTDGLSAREAMIKFDLKSPSQVFNWLRQYREQGIDGLKPKPKGRTKLMPKPIKLSKADQDKTQKELLEELAYLRAENAFLKKLKALRLEQEAKEAAEQQRLQDLYQLRQTYSLKHLLHAAKMSRSTYYYHVQIYKHEDQDYDLKKKIRVIYHQHKGRYGYRRITLALRNLGLVINHKCVQRLMQSMQLKSRVRATKYRSYKGQVGKIADNVLQRQFKAEQPNQKWVTDVTEFNVRGEKLYLSPVMDLFNGEIIAFHIQRRPVFGLVKDMLKKAIDKLKPDDKPMIHSDQGWQNQMHYYQEQLKQNGLTQSMSRKGNCLDNASMESFFGILKSECFYGEEFKSIDELEQVVKKYIHYYNHDRIKVKLKGLSPVQYRNQSLKTT